MAYSDLVGQALNRVNELVRSGDEAGLRKMHAAELALGGKASAVVRVIWEGLNELDSDDHIPGLA